MPPSLDEASAELLRRCLALRNASRDERCPECGRRAHRSPEFVRLMVQVDICERARERAAFEGEAVTRPATPKRKR